MEQSVFTLIFRNVPICTVDTDLSTSADAVLPLPEFNQPGAAVIIKIDRLAVEYHLKPESLLVIEMAVAVILLPCVHAGSKDILGQHVLEAEGNRDLIDALQLFTYGHLLYFAYCGGSAGEET